MGGGGGAGGEGVCVCVCVWGGGGLVHGRSSYLLDKGCNPGASQKISWEQVVFCTL